MNKNFVKKTNCPYCLHNIDSAINEFDETVNPACGDITLCIQCGEVSEFDFELNLIKFNLSKLNAIDLMDIRKKQYIIAKINYKESKLQ